MNIHLIAIGGSIMHNLAMELQALGHQVTGSDDEIYDPARSRLASVGLLPEVIGWDADSITEEKDLVILGMHAQLDNPELIKAQKLGLRIVSFPEYIAEHIKDKKKIVVTGSHGKTTTTSMIMHVLRTLDYDFDYLVGGIIDGFDRMVRMSDTADIAVVEGDEYLSSRLDSRPKMLHYQGDVIITTGVAWDHMNVFPTYDDYLKEFRTLFSQIDDDGMLIWSEDDELLKELVQSQDIKGEIVSYDALDTNADGQILYNEDRFNPEVFGRHNMANMHAAMLACQQVGIDPVDFLSAIEDFSGAGKRLEKICEKPLIYRDFAHAPSKVKATTEAVRQKHQKTKIKVVLELHTYSSLSKAFIPQYAGALDGADECIVFFDPHAVRMKRLDPLDHEDVYQAFQHTHIQVLSDVEQLRESLGRYMNNDAVYLLMSSGNFGGINMLELIEN